MQLLYQSPPTVRVVFLNSNKTISLHSDSSYPNHDPNEINLWISITHVYDSNSLYVESVPLSNDFTPLRMSYGQDCVFNGYAFRLFTQQNDTGSCRISFDF
mmetsp:Transcript_37439/g.49646  ORF Transcript_37439/g.49646 Transcript_37439/m.49646 type:complete len:101 (+) Transcript_37439:518-820(+)